MISEIAVVVSEKVELLSLSRMIVCVMALEVAASVSSARFEEAADAMVWLKIGRRDSDDVNTGDSRLIELVDELNV